ncbi:hypothetical protein THAOC_31313 [Thalassiosira oceanica]|uniref:Uncharacterized protein n=1 Tax=Thalassiosira oceanica TaxID=159749 RepID=K0RT07_THAOC|nr:hypothetical protein THAOC_31313 [Thalassiosira oceanica]|eukprot:EJK49777.1 hypothetical protein THAOC_31313 [Thalassiosira oceanica]
MAGKNGAMSWARRLKAREVLKNIARPGCSDRDLIYHIGVYCMPNEVRGLLYCVDDRYRMQDVRVSAVSVPPVPPALAMFGMHAQAERSSGRSASPQDNARIPAHRRAPGPGMPSKSTRAT